MTEESNGGIQQLQAGCQFCILSHMLPKYPGGDSFGDAFCGVGMFSQAKIH